MNDSVKSCHGRGIGTVWKPRGKGTSATGWHSQEASDNAKRLRRPGVSNSDL
jgi:hypothetical protein